MDMSICRVRVDYSIMLFCNLTTCLSASPTDLSQHSSRDVHVKFTCARIDLP